MNNPSTLITVAMLTSFLEKGHKDYLDLMKPFVLKVLPSNSKEMIDSNCIKSSLEKEYGFVDLPIYVINNILERCTKSNPLNVYKDKKQYYVGQPFDSKDFESSRKVIKRSLDDVIDKLKTYFDTYTTVFNMSPEKVLKAFNAFLEEYGYSIIGNVNELRQLTKSELLNYHVARFIIAEAEKQSVIFDNIMEIVKGFFVYKAIYFFGENNKKDFNSKLKSTEVYLDTRLILNALGYNTELEAQATRELLTLVIESGGILKTFEHNKDELAGILTKYAKSPLARSTMSLDYFDRNNYQEVDVLRLRETLEINLKAHNISVVETPSQNASSEENPLDRGFIDCVKLKESLEEAYLSVNSKPKNGSIDRDVASIASISLLRGKQRNVGIESCKAIFVTTNFTFTNIVKVFFRERFAKGEINFIITDIDMAALLWLRTFDKENDLPKRWLLENAYAAIRPSDEILEVFADKVVKMQLEGSITPEMAVLLRTQHVVREEIAALTENNPEKMSSTVVMQIKDTYLKSLTQQKNDELEALRIESARKVAELERESQEKLKKLEQDLTRKAEQEANEKKAGLIKAAEERSKAASLKYYKLIKRITSIAVGVIFVGGIVITVLDSITKFESTTLKSVAVIMTLFGIVGIYDLTVGRIKKIDNILIKLRQTKFDKCHKIEMDKLNDNI